MLTRCPQCTTTFRVKPEQLKARLGRVRCGQCQTVFNALDSLVEEGAATATAPAEHIAPVETTEPIKHEVETAPGEEALEMPAALDDAGEVPEELAQPTELEISAASDTAEPFPLPPSMTEAPEIADLEAANETFVAPTEPAVASIPEPRPGAASDTSPAAQAALRNEPAPEEAEWPTEPTAAAEAEPESAPAAAEPPIHDLDTSALDGVFHRRLPPLVAPAELETPVPAAEVPAPALAPDPLLHSTPPRTPRHWPWAVAAGFATSLLLIQLAIHYRVELAVLVPSLKPALQATCRPLGCDVPLPHKIDLLSLESSDLHPGRQKGQLQLNAQLKNKAPFTQELPVLELTLTDVADRALIVKALKPADYLPAGQKAEAGFPAKGELSVKLTLDAGDTPAVGYRLYLYYP